MGNRILYESYLVKIKNSFPFLSYTLYKVKLALSLAFTDVGLKKKIIPINANFHSVDFLSCIH